MTLKAIKHGILTSITFVICTTGIVYAAISWPATPSGETAGGKIASVLNTILSSGDWKNPWDGSVKKAAATAPSGISFPDGSVQTTAGKILQVVGTQRSDYFTTTTAIPWDDTIPQNTEGGEVFSVSITPKSATSKLIIESAVIGNETANHSDHFIVALFQDSGTNALASAHAEQYGDASIYSGLPSTLHLRYQMTAGTTSPITFRIRAGANGGALEINGGGGARKLGGTIYSSLLVTEIGQ